MVVFRHYYYYNYKGPWLNLGLQSLLGNVEFFIKGSSTDFTHESPFTSVGHYYCISEKQIKPFVAPEGAGNIHKTTSLKMKTMWWCVCMCEIKKNNNSGSSASI